LKVPTGALIFLNYDIEHILYTSLRSTLAASFLDQASAVSKSIDVVNRQNLFLVAWTMTLRPKIIAARLQRRMATIFCRSKSWECVAVNSEPDSEQIRSESLT